MPTIQNLRGHGMSSLVLQVEPCAQTVQCSDTELISFARKTPSFRAGI
jgi:hypothetical protein